MNFIDAVNRVLRNNLILRGDDDNLTNFADTTHEATSILAQQAIQSELNYLSAQQILPTERATGSITTVASQRTYNLPADFIEFYGTIPFLYDVANPTEYIFEYPGGFDRLRIVDRLWHTQEGGTIYWYYEEQDSASTQAIGLWQIPNTEEAGKQYSFDYSKSVDVVAFDDRLPFFTQEAFDIFCDMASRRFFFLRTEGLNLSDIAQDFAWRQAYGALVRIMVKRIPRGRYGRRFVGFGRIINRRV